MARGRHRIYLGAAPGVGKTVAMLDEGAPAARPAAPTSSSASSRPTGASTPRRWSRASRWSPGRGSSYRGATLRGDGPRRACWPGAPSVALVDELAHTNVPGSRHEKRWQDVDELLDAGIDVISTVNIQHLESLNDVVESITGVVQRETVPDEVVRRADQIELVDMSPEALRRRMAHGNIYKAEKVDAALANYFRVGNLSALRELALLWLADRVEEGSGPLPGRPRHRLVVADPRAGRRRAVRRPRGRDPAAARRRGSPRAAPAASCSRCTSPAPTA